MPSTHHRRRDRRDLTGISGFRLYAELQEMIRRGRSAESCGQFLERALVTRVNEEREQLAEALLQLEVDPGENFIRCALVRDTSEGVHAAVSVTRRRAAKLCRDRIEDLDDVGDDDVPPQSA